MRYISVLFLLLAVVMTTGCDEGATSPPAGEDTNHVVDTNQPDDGITDPTTGDDIVADLVDTPGDDGTDTTPDPEIIEPLTCEMMDDYLCEEIDPLIGKWCHAKEGCNFPTFVEFCPHGIGVRFIGSPHDLLNTVDFTGDTLPLDWGEFDEFNGKLYMFTLDLEESGKLRLREYQGVPLEDPEDFDPNDFEHDIEVLFNRAN